MGTALDRAAGRHELFNRVPFPPACSCGVEMPDGNVRENFAAHLDDVARTARAAVAAALHDPDDDVIARTIDAHRAIWVPGLECSCQRWPFDESDDQTMQGFARHQADAVRAAILGSSS